MALMHVEGLLLNVHWVMVITPGILLYSYCLGGYVIDELWEQW